MIKTGKRPKIFFGWWTVLTAGFLCILGHGYREYGFSALFKPIASELGFNRATTSVAAGIGRFEGGFEAPITGWITDRFGPRGIVLFGVFIISISLILMNYVNSLWAFYIIWGVVFNTGANITLGIPLDAAISSWFVKKRGLAMGVKHMLSGLSGVLIVPFIVWLTITQGWRTTCVVGGLIIGLIGFPLSWFSLKRHRPEYYGMLPDGASNSEKGAETNAVIEKGVHYAAEVNEIEFTLRQAMRTPSYWTMLVAHAFHSLVAPTISIHMIPFLTDSGIEPIKAGGMVSMMAAVGIPARLISGVLTDRIGIRRFRFMLAIAYLLEATGLGIFLLFQTEVTIYIWLVLHGAGMGAAWMLSPPVRARYFGRKAYGSISGSQMLLMAPVGILAPIYAGWVYDTTGSYLSVFKLFTGLLFLAAAIACFITPPRVPTSISKVRDIM